VAQRWEATCEYVDRESGGKADRVEFRRMFTDGGQGTRSRNAVTERHLGDYEDLKKRLKRAATRGL